MKHEDHFRTGPGTAGARIARSFTTALTLVLAHAAAAGAAPRLQASLGRDLSLAGERTPGVYEFEILTSVSPLREDGSRAPADTLRARLVAELTRGPSGGVTRYTCRSFTYTRGGAAAVDVPALAGWGYVYRGAAAPGDSGAPMFGIDQAVFQGLRDATGAMFGPGEAYMVYNTFVDFHAFCDVFARPSPAGPGIQDLRRLGDRVRHAASQSRPGVDLPGNVSKGSYFRNGEIVLELRALSLPDGAPCALVGYDSGESTFEMQLEPVPGVITMTAGGSRYTGDIEVDLATLWPRRVHMNEFIVSTTTVTMPGGGEPQKIRSVHDRQCRIRMIEAVGRPAR